MRAPSFIAAETCFESFFRKCFGTLSGLLKDDLPIEGRGSALRFEHTAERGWDQRGCEDGVINRLTGQVLRRTRRREAAIFLHAGSLWVADFIDGDGEIVDAATWVRFHCGGAAFDSAWRRMAQESAVPLTPELQRRILSLLRWTRVRSGQPVKPGPRSAESPTNASRHTASLGSRTAGAPAPSPQTKRFAP
jgi:hypothetical protein